MNDVIWNIVNSTLAGLLVLAGAMADGTITRDGVMVSLGAAAVVAIMQFREYIVRSGKVSHVKLFKFI